MRTVVALCFALCVAATGCGGTKNAIVTTELGDVDVLPAFVTDCPVAGTNGNLSFPGVFGLARTCNKIADSLLYRQGPSKFEIRMKRSICHFDGWGLGNSEEEDIQRACTGALRDSIEYFHRHGIDRDVLAVAQDAALFGCESVRGDNRAEFNQLCGWPLQVFGSTFLPSDLKLVPGDAIYPQIASRDVAEKMARRLCNDVPYDCRYARALGLGGINYAKNAQDGNAFWSEINAQRERDEEQEREARRLRAEGYRQYLADQAAERRPPPVHHGPNESIVQIVRIGTRVAQCFYFPAAAACWASCRDTQRNPNVSLCSCWDSNGSEGQDECPR